MEYDQHFMVNEKLLDHIASLIKTDYVVEVGPGQGALTDRLLEKARVKAVEADPKMVALLKEDFPEDIADGSLYIEEGSVLEKDFKDLSKYTNTLVSNLPYSISESFFYKLIDSKFDHIILVTGKKFYDLLCADTKLGFYRKTFFNIKKISDVSKTCFDPQPRVDSVFFRLDRKNNKDFFTSFLLQDDKKLKNALINTYIEFDDLTKREAKEKVASLKIGEKTLDKRITHLSNIQFREIVARILDNF